MRFMASGALSFQAVRLSQPSSHAVAASSESGSTRLMLAFSLYSRFAMSSHTMSAGVQLRTFTLFFRPFSSTSSRV